MQQRHSSLPLTTVIKIIPSNNNDNDNDNDNDKWYIVVMIIPHLLVITLCTYYPQSTVHSPQCTIHCRIAACQQFPGPHFLLTHLAIPNTVRYSYLLLERGLIRSRKSITSHITHHISHHAFPAANHNYHPVAANSHQPPSTHIVILLHLLSYLSRGTPHQTCK